MQGIHHGGAVATEVELQCSELGRDLWALILSAKDGGGQGGAHLALNRADVPRRFHGGITAVPSLAGRWRTGRGRVDGSLSVCSGGSNAGLSCKATKRVRMAGTGLTARSIVEELTMGRLGRAPMVGRRWSRIWGKL